MASTAKRRRELERAKWERQRARRAEQARRRNTTVKLVAIVVAIAAVIGAAVLIAVTTGNDAPVASDEPTAAATAEAAVAGSTCQYRETDSEAVDALGLPGDLADGAALPTSATISLNGQPVQVALLAPEAPCTVHSFSFLAAGNFFDGTGCHRLTTSESLKILQCGDPTGTGNGGPGYAFDNENTDGATYPAGTLAMANAGPDTNGSQFFLVYDDSELTPDYTVFGTVTSGLDVLTGIAAGGATDEAPNTPVTIDDITTAS
ncbi:MAG TPA: peptidylprolyl isomerase [Jiangellaceae bacterium]|nr:peptidylprolyl isomerase [Jiangellaceae bacterium]